MPHTLIEGCNTKLKTQLLEHYGDRMTWFPGNLTYQTVLPILRRDNLTHTDFLVETDVRVSCSTEKPNKETVRFLESRRGIERILLSKQSVQAVILTEEPGKEYLNNLYQKSSSESHLRSFALYDADYNINQAIDFLESLRSPENEADGIGMFAEGNMLIVGEQPAEQKGRLDYPFAADVGSSRWLNQQLDSIDFPEQYLYWINAIRADGTETAPNFLDNLMPTLIIALGKQAEAWCKKHDLAYTSHPHPSYWKRFKSKEPYPLLDSLKAGYAFISD